MSVLELADDFLSCHIAPGKKTRQEFFNVRVRQQRIAVFLANPLVKIAGFGLIGVVLVGLVIVGGIKRIGQVASKLVPFMAAVYVITALVALAFVLAYFVKKYVLPKFKVEVDTDKAYYLPKETIKGKTEKQGRHKKQTGGSGQYAKIDYTIEPAEPGEGFSFDSKITGGSIPKEFIPAVEKGFKQMLGEGPLCGFPVVDFKVTLYDGNYHEVDSSEMAFKIAGSMGFKTGVQKAKPVILEPMMKVEVETPEEYMGDVMGDLNRRRGIVGGMDDAPSGKIIRAEVPLAEMFGYATDLRSATQGRATYSMEFEKYNEAPANIAEEVIKKAS